MLEDFAVSEYITEEGAMKKTVKANILYRWKAKEDSIEKYAKA